MSTIHQHKPKILVTGGLGYIGSHTVIELLNNDYEVVIVDNLSNSQESIADQLMKITGQNPECYCFDLCDEELVNEFAKSQPDIAGIIHFAAYKAVGESVEQPLKYYKNNIQSLLNLLQAFSNRAINFVFSSSCTVYGQPDELPVTELAPIKKTESPYGNTKQIAESILADFARVNLNFRVAVLRYFNPVGAHPSALIGELPIGIPQNLVPFITQTAIGKRTQLTVYGNDYPTLDGSCVRDYIHVVDLAQAHVAALRYLRRIDNDQSFEAFNIGTGKGTTVLQMINTFEAVTGQKLNYTIGNRREGDIAQIWADVTFAQEKLSWNASLTLEEMLQSAWNWELYLQQHPLK